MKILLSAYDCEPGKGSEAGVGWRWAVEIAKLGHSVHVLTREKCRASIEANQAEVDRLGLKFDFLPLPKALSFLDNPGKGEQLYYILWQFLAPLQFKRLATPADYDFVHHITYGTLRFPSFLWKLDIPFIFGPVGGGERGALELDQSISSRGRAVERARNASRQFIKMDPFVQATLKNSALILVKNAETAELIPASATAKTVRTLEIGTTARPRIENKKKPSGKILYAGRFLYWKGMGVGLKAFAKALETVPEARLTMVGSGPEALGWRQLVQELSIQTHVDWIEWVPQAEMDQIYRSHDVLLFPSLHDSSGNVLLEAASYGLPSVSLALGGAGEIVEDMGGKAIPVRGQTEKQIVEALAARLVILITSDEERSAAADAALKWAAANTWSTSVSKIYGPTGLAAGLARS